MNPINIISEIDNSLSELVELNERHTGSINSKSARKEAAKIKAIKEKIESFNQQIQQMQEPSLQDRIWGLLGYRHEKRHWEAVASRIQKQFDEQIALFTKDLGIQATRLSEKREIQRATQLCRLGLSLQPKDRGCQENLANCLLLDGKIKEAKEMYLTLARRYPREPSYQLKLQVFDQFSDQLHRLGAVCASVKETTSVMLFAVTLMEETVTEKPPLFPRSNSIAQAQKFLGKLILITDRHPTKVGELLNLRALDAYSFPTPKGKKAVRGLQSELQKSVQKVEGAFISEIESQAKIISNHWQVHKKSRIQDTDLAVSQFVPSQIASLLVTSGGHLNTDIITEAQHYLMHPEKHWLPFEQDIGRVLKALKNDPSLRDKLASIKKPPDPMLPGNHVIRATLGLTPDEPITDRHAQITALTGLLSHWRQQNIMSCFISCFTVQQFRHGLHECLSDLSQLLTQGSIARIVQGKKQSFPFILKMTNDSLQKTICVNRKGQLLDAEEGLSPYQPLHLQPGFIAACRAIGITDVETAIKNGLKVYKGPEPIEITCRKLIELVVKGNRVLDSEACDLACYYFEAQLQSPMLRAWENAVAGMNEILPNESLNETLMTCFKSLSKFNKLGIAEQVCTDLIQNTQWLYDSDVDCGDDYEAGFVLYDKGTEQDPTKWKRIDNPIRFLRALVVSTERVVTEKLKTVVDPSIRKSLNDLLPVLKTSAFLRKMVRKYHPDNGKISDDQDLDSLEHTPWRNLDGGDPQTLGRIYHSADRGPPKLSLKEAPIKEQAVHILQMCRAIRKADRGQKIQGIPICSKNHAFTLLPNHPSLTKGTDSYPSIEAWLEETIIKPGQAIANTKITPEIRQKLDAYILDRFVPEAEREEFQNALHALFKDVTITEYRQGIENLMSKDPEQRYHPLEDTMQRIDTFLVDRGLTPELREQLLRTAVPFADSNWMSSVHDNYYQLMVNPGSGELEIVMMNLDGSDFSPIRENFWGSFDFILPPDIHRRLRHAKMQESFLTTFW